MPKNSKSQRILQSMGNELDLNVSMSAACIRETIENITRRFIGRKVTPETLDEIRAVLSAGLEKAGLKHAVRFMVKPDKYNWGAATIVPLDVASAMIIAGSLLLTENDDDEKAKSGV